LIKDKLIDLELGKRALLLVSQEKLSLDDALKKLGWTQSKRQSTARLGELLLAADLITETQLNEALRTSRETGLPLGRILVLTQAISDEMLSSALTAQVLIRDGKLTKEHACQGLKSAKRRRVTIEVSLSDHGFYRPPNRQTVKLGELLVLTGLVSEGDLMNALELGLTREMPIGEVLVQSGFISKDILFTALKLQEMVANGTLNALQASETLRQISTRNISIAQAVGELGLLKPEQNEAIKLSDILKAAGVVTDDDIHRAIETSSRNSALLGKMLVVTGMIDEGMLNASLRCMFLVREGFLNMEQAIIALSHCQRHHASFDDALQELGWTINTRMNYEG
jgi:ribosome-associated protein YbcJ (S4-like RNA binding protein)